MRACVRARTHCGGWPRCSLACRLQLSLSPLRVARSPNAAPWKPAYHGIVRAIVRANVVAVGDRALLAAVNVDAGVGTQTATILPNGSAPPTSMTITASAPGLAPVSVTVALSVNPQDEVLAVAAASVGAAAMGE